MALIKKKGEKGAASNYITRTRAIRKLQLSLADFRRLCILKGIYPRQPSSRKKAAGASGNTAQTFYYSKDIQFLLHEPLVQKLRDRKAFMKKLSRAIGKREDSLVRKLEENRPDFTLDHLVKERYPTFIDSLRDLDDCLCHVFMFATLPTTDNVVKKHIEDSQRLAAEFQNYVIASHSLRKVFLSIKGIYYQAEIKGQTITWLVPYLFSQDIPADVDFRVMLTFLEFYQTTLGFVNYKLYHDANLFYPPKLDAKLDEHGAGLIASYIIESTAGVASADNTEANRMSRKEKTALKKLATDRVQTLDTALIATSGVDSSLATVDDDAVENEAMVDELPVDVFPDTEELVGSQQQRLATLQSLFAGKRIFLSREVPRHSLEFVIRAFGGIVAWPETSGPGSPYAESSADITHHVVDRPAESLALLEGRAYVQPQWIFDCVNMGQLLETEPYRPGATLPPHMSPFVAVESSEEIARQLDMEEEEQALLQETQQQLSTAADNGGDVLQRVQQAQSAETLHELELEAEVSGVSYDKVTAATAGTTAKRIDPALKKKQQAQKMETERVEMAKMLMSNKKRKLLQKIESSKTHKAADAKKLEQRRRTIAATKK